MKLALALITVEVAQDLEDQGVAEEDVAEEYEAEEGVAEVDAISKRNSDKRTVVIIDVSRFPLRQYR